MSHVISATSDRTALLDCLWEFQIAHGYISDENVNECAEKLGISSIEVEGVLSFYHFFSRTPRGEFTVYLNNSAISEIRGYHRVRDAFEKETGSTFEDANLTDRFGLFETPCIGLSDYEPAALINFYPFTNLNSLKVRKIVAALRQGAHPKDICDDVDDHIRYRPEPDHTVLLRNYTPGTALKKLTGKSPEDVLSMMDQSDVRGLGGAFFPVGRKWRYCAAEKAQPKYVVSNADEGEPGTFKDRILLNSYSGLMLEGMAIAGYAVGAEHGIIYLRAEYRWLLHNLESTISDFREHGLLGNSIAGIEGFNFDVRVQVGAGSYVCGEETALLNSCEGKRGEPRTKQYRPSSRGFLDQPTIVNNVETFCAAARVMELGTDFYKTTGTETSPGTKLLSISGDCKAPGIYEIPWGTTVREVLSLCQAEDPYFIQVSGPSGECIGMSDLDRVISMDDLRCGGSFMIFNSKRSLIDIMINFADFFKSESCGVCTPCRAGNFLVRHQLEKFKRGLARDHDVSEIIKWGKIMHDTSRCGLGKVATHSLCIALKKFSQDFDRSTAPEAELFNRGFKLDQAIEEYEQFNS